MRATALLSPATKTLVAALFLALTAGCATVEREFAAPMAGAPVAVEPEPQAAPPPEPMAAANEAKVESLPAKPIVKVHSGPVAAPAPKPAMPPVAVLVPEPPLDIDALKLRLRQTKALGTMTKLSLNGQMDDLLKRFRAVYQSGQTSVTALRAPYDALVAKVLGLLQKGDPALARSIASSREAIWKILADPEKFGSLG
jgi:hypothetical protein